MGALLNLARGAPGPAESASPTEKSTLTDADANRVHARSRALNDVEDERRLDPAAETRRQRVLAMLAQKPGVRYAVVADDKANPEAVILVLAMRGATQDGSPGTFELHVPRAKYDPCLLLDLMDKYGANVH